MASFFANCETCGSLIARGATCPKCKRGGQASEGDDEAGGGTSLAAEYSRRKATHTTNYSIYMYLMFGTGLAGVLAAGCWILIIYRGSLLALVVLGVTNVLALGLGVLLSMAKKMFPTELECPKCDVRLEEIGLNAGCCPGCNAQLQD